MAFNGIDVGLGIRDSQTDLKDGPPPECGRGARVEDVVDLHAGKVGGRRQRVVGAGPGGGRRGHDAGQRPGRGHYGPPVGGPRGPRGEPEQRVRGRGLAPSSGVSVSATSHIHCPLLSF